MKRRRHALQVSTFPFLAVLLCAMGSLILLLLVIDRRAKAVARAKALQLVARRAADAEQNASRRRDELHERRQAMYDEQKSQTEAALIQLETVRGRSSTAKREADAEKKRRADMERKIGTLTDDIATRQADIKTAAKQTEEHSRERGHMTDELVRLENALADFKAKRQQEKPTYSLIPYRGKQGDNRRPLYIECTATNLVCHPERSETDVSGLRNEIESRIATRRASETPALDDPTYVLFLVRPAGIATYYGSMTVLAGMKLEFGYEFVDDDWVFDFSVNDKNTAQRPMDDRPAAVVSRESKSSVLPGVLADANVGAGTAPSGDNGWTGRGGVAALGPPGRGQPNNNGPTPSSVLAPMPNTAGRSSSILATTLSADSTLGGFGRRSEPVSEPSKIANTQTGRAAASGTSNVTKQSVVHQPGAQATGDVTAPSLALRAGKSLGGAAASDSPELPSGTRAVGDQPAPSLAPTASSGDKPRSETGSMPPSMGATHTAPATQGTQESERQRVTPLSPFADASSSVGGRPVRITPSRDWVISVECTSKGILVSPGAIPFSFAALTLTHADNPLQLNLQQMLSRRQSMTRPGEPGERPVIHFRIRPDGLRAYHLAYQIVERLRVPMTRENLPGESVPREGSAEAP